MTSSATRKNACSHSIAHPNTLPRHTCPGHGARRTRVDKNVEMRKKSDIYTQRLNALARQHESCQISWDETDILRRDGRYNERKTTCNSRLSFYCRRQCGHVGALWGNLSTMPSTPAQAAVAAALTLLVMSHAGMSKKKSACLTQLVVRWHSKAHYNRNLLRFIKQVVAGPSRSPAATQSAMNNFRKLPLPCSR